MPRAAWLIVIVAWSTPAAAQPSHDDARSLYLEARFREAASAFEAVLARSDLDVPTAADAHVHLAVLRHMLGEPERARAHVEAAVALVPDVSVPEGAPEEVVALVSGARADLGGAPVRLTLDVEADETARHVRARMDPAPSALELGLFLRCDGAEARGAPPEVEVRVPNDRPARCEATARSSGGAILFGVRRELAPAAALEATIDEGASPWPWVGLAAGVAVAAGIAIAIVATSSSGDGPVLSATEIDAGGW